MSTFSERLRNYAISQGIKPAEIARRLGVGRSYVSMLLDDKRSPSARVVKELERLEREAERDPYLVACERILTEGDEQLVRGFLVNIYGLVAQVPGSEDESRRLKEMVSTYMEIWSRRKEKRARSGP